MGDAISQEDTVEIGFSSKDGISKEQLVMESWKKCVNKRSQEMKRGYFNIKFDKDGNAHKIWIPDTREEYINSIIALDLLLTADYDKRYETSKYKVMRGLKTAFKTYGWKTYRIRRVPIPNVYNGFKFTKELTGEVVMPEPDSLLFDINSEGKRIRIDWTNNYNNYMQTQVMLYDELFQALVRLLYRHNYFKGSSSHEEGGEEGSK